MQDIVGAPPCPQQYGATVANFTEDQLLAFDRYYAAAKDTGVLERMQASTALNLDLSHNRSARLA